MSNADSMCNLRSNIIYSKPICFAPNDLPAHQKKHLRKKIFRDKNQHLHCYPWLSLKVRYLHWLWGPQMALGCVCRWTTCRRKGFCILWLPGQWGSTSWEYLQGSSHFHRMWSPDRIFRYFELSTRLKFHFCFRTESTILDLFKI